MNKVSLRSILRGNMPEVLFRLRHFFSKGEEKVKLRKQKKA